LTLILNFAFLGIEVFIRIFPGELKLFKNEHDEQARARQTNGLRDEPRCGALSLLKKPLHYKGVHLNSCSAFVYVGLGPVVARARVLFHEVLGRGAQADVRGGAR
jgi:hypothetical protein